MLKAKLDAARKNKKGFSLVELIIVVAIMVALIAVLAPSYVKYVTRSRDAALQTAAEDLATALKTDFADPEGLLTPAATEITVTISDSTKTLNINYGDLDATKCAEIAGLDAQKKMNVGTPGLTFKITVSSAGVVTGPVSQVNS